DAMMMMGGRVELRREVAARARGARGLGCLEAMRIVAVAARHARAVHPGLQERPVLVDLTEDLAVGVIQVGFEQRRPVRVEQGAAVNVTVIDDAPPRVTPSARLHLES